jgi:hypothetical protein
MPADTMSTISALRRADVAVAPHAAANRKVTEYGY